MDVTIRWSEKASYQSTINVEESEVREWMRDGDDPNGEITADVVKDFLEAGDESDWFEQCDTDDDYMGSEDREIDDVTDIDTALFKPENAGGLKPKRAPEKAT